MNLALYHQTRDAELAKRLEAIRNGLTDLSLNFHSIALLEHSQFLELKGVQEEEVEEYLPHLEESRDPEEEHWEVILNQPVQSFTRAFIEEGKTYFLQ